MHHGDAVADAFGAENADRFANQLRRANLSGMADDAKSFVTSMIERGTEMFGWECELVATHAESNDAEFLKSPGSERDF